MLLCRCFCSPQRRRCLNLSPALCSRITSAPWQACGISSSQPLHTGRWRIPDRGSHSETSSKSWSRGRGVVVWSDWLQHTVVLKDSKRSWSLRSSRDSGDLFGKRKKGVREANHRSHFPGPEYQASFISHFHFPVASW